MPWLIMKGVAGLSDIDIFRLQFLAKWSDRSLDCLRPEVEFRGCSGMSFRTVGKYHGKAKPAMPSSLSLLFLPIHSLMHTQPLF